MLTFLLTYCQDTELRRSLDYVSLLDKTQPVLSVGWTYESVLHRCCEGLMFRIFRCSPRPRVTLLLFLVEFLKRKIKEKQLSIFYPGITQISWLLNNTFSLPNFLRYICREVPELNMESHLEFLRRWQVNRSFRFWNQICIPFLVHTDTGQTTEQSWKCGRDPRCILLSLGLVCAEQNASSPLPSTSYSVTTYFFFLCLTEVWLPYNVILVEDVQHNDICIYCKAIPTINLVNTSLLT